jgi:hypothetical protein
MFTPCTEWPEQRSDEAFSSSAGAAARTTSRVPWAGRVRIFLCVRPAQALPSRVRAFFAIAAAIGHGAATVMTRPPDSATKVMGLPSAPQRAQCP